MKKLFQDNAENKENVFPRGGFRGCNIAVR